MEPKRPARGAPLEERLDRMAKNKQRPPWQVAARARQFRRMWATDKLKPLETEHERLEAEIRKGGLPKEQLAERLARVTEIQQEVQRISGESASAQMRLAEMATLRDGRLFFRVHDGQELKSLDELRAALHSMPDDLYRYHAERGDWAKWIREVYGLEELAKRAEAAKKKEDLVALLR